MIEVAQDTGTHAVIKSAHFDRLIPLVSRRGFTLGLHQRMICTNVIKKKVISEIKKNHNQYW